MCAEVRGHFGELLLAFHLVEKGSLLFLLLPSIPQASWLLGDCLHPSLRPRRAGTLVTCNHIFMCVHGIQLGLSTLPCKCLVRSSVSLALPGCVTFGSF